MRIAVLSSNYIKLPPTSDTIPKGWSGGPEKVMYIITEELVKRGHQVFLFAPGNSKTSAQLISVTDRATYYFYPPIGEKTRIDYEHLLISKCYSMAKEGYFDLIHSIHDVRSAFYAQFTSIPTISTLHSPLSDHKKIILEKFKKAQYYVSISNAQRKPLPDLNYIAKYLSRNTIKQYFFFFWGRETGLYAFCKKTDTRKRD